MSSRLGMLLILLLALALPTESTAAAPGTCEIPGGPKQSNQVDCLARLFAGCDEDHRHVMRNCTSSYTKTCSRGCCAIAAEAQRQVCRANACIGAIDGCSSTGVCSCDAVLPMSACQPDTVCRDAVMVTCLDDCEERGWDEEAALDPSFTCGAIVANEKIATCGDLRDTAPAWSRARNPIVCPEVCPEAEPYCVETARGPQCSPTPHTCAEACPSHAPCARVGGGWECVEG